MAGRDDQGGYVAVLAFDPISPHLRTKKGVIRVNFGALLKIAEAGPDRLFCVLLGGALVRA
tara:strand:+ start:4448 stop:4630 length:183 start_codon:yes stop_codon:yes gene_type:complete